LDKTRPKLPYFEMIERSSGVGQQTVNRLVALWNSTNVERKALLNDARSCESARRPRRSVRRTGAGPLDLVDQFLQGRVDGFRSGSARPFVPNYALGIDDVKGWSAGRFPLAGNDARVDESSPAQVFLDYYLFNFARIFTAVVEVDSDQDEGLAAQLFDERPLVGPLGASGES
jgi:hypothetical protein